MLVLPQRKLIRKVPVRSLSFHTSSTDIESSSVTAPASVQYGDLLVLSDIMGSFSAPAAAVPSGFNIVTSLVADELFRHILSWKIADGSEAGADLGGMSGILGGAKILLVFRPDVPINEVTVSSGGQESTSGNPASQNVVASGKTPPLIIIGSYNTTGGAISPRTFTPAKAGEVNETATNANCWLAYRIDNSAPADTTIDMDNEGENVLVSRCFQAS